MCFSDAPVVQLGSINSYKILSQSNCTALDGVDDAEEFRRVQAALDTIGVDEESQMQVWKMLASVLHMSNLEFDKVDHEQGDIASISNRQVRTYAHFLHGLFRLALWTRRMERGRHSCRIYSM